MKILTVSDEECPALWDYYVPGRLAGYDLILACGDLKSDYLSFLVTMAKCPVMYVHGNHDTGYAKRPPLGCDCIDGKVVVYNGLRIMGLGGCRRYHPGEHQYSEKEMARRIRKLWFALWRTKGVDIVVTHAPVEGLGDGQDNAHKGFAAFRKLMEKYKPSYLVHGHMHLNYGQDKTRVRQFGDTKVINATERYELTVEDRPFPLKNMGRILWINGEPDRGDDF